MTVENIYNLIEAENLIPPKAMLLDAARYSLQMQINAYNGNPQRNYEDRVRIDETDPKLLSWVTAGNCHRGSVDVIDFFYKNKLTSQFTDMGLIVAEELDEDSQRVIGSHTCAFVGYEDKGQQKFSAISPANSGHISVEQRKLGLTLDTYNRLTYCVDAGSIEDLIQNFEGIDPDFFQPQFRVYIHAPVLRGFKGLSFEFREQIR